MRRREFIALLGAAATWQFGARAQQPAKPVIGFLHSGALSGYRNLMISFRKGLSALGFVDGENIIIEYAWAEGHFERLPQLAANLIQRGPGVIVTGGIGSALAARKASATIPLVFLAGDDPVKFGLVASLNQPGDSTTGIAWLTSELFTKRLEIIRELVPAAELIGVLINPKSPELEPQRSEIETAAKALAQRLHFANASSGAEFDTAFARLSKEHISALIVSNDAFFNSARERIVALAAHHRVPTIYDRREYSLTGGLISYGTSYSAAYYELGTYTGKILKGTSPRELPVEQATKFELVINLKTANSLALEIPSKILALADEMIE